MIKKIIIMSLFLNFSVLAQPSDNQYNYIKEKAFQQVAIYEDNDTHKNKILSDIDGFTNSIGFLQHFFVKKDDFNPKYTYEIYRKDKTIEGSKKSVYFKIGDAKFLENYNNLSKFEIISSKTLFKKDDLVVAKGLKTDPLINTSNTELKEKIYFSHILNKNEGSFLDTVLLKQNNELKIGSKLNIYRESAKVEDYELPPKKVGEIIITDFQGGYAIGFISKTNDFIRLKDFVK